MENGSTDHGGVIPIESRKHPDTDDAMPHNRTGKLEPLEKTEKVKEAHKSNS